MTIKKWRSEVAQSADLQDLKAVIAWRDKEILALHDWRDSLAEARHGLGRTEAAVEELTLAIGRKAAQPSEDETRGPGDNG